MKIIQEVPKLEELCLRRVCLDIPRHNARHEAETDKDNSYYRHFMLIYSDEVLKRLQERYRYHGTAEMLYENFVKPMRPCLNFLFNPLLRKIPKRSRFFHPEIISTIARNCKDLWSFDNTRVPIYTDVYITLFSSMKQLVVLNLLDCQFSGIQVLKTIAKSLVHLRILDLSGTNVDDQGVFLLCGHETSFPEQVPSCCFTKQCESNSSLGLYSLKLHSTSVSYVALACVLTHIPTIKQLEPNRIVSINEASPTEGMLPFFLSGCKLLAEVICEIDKRRKGCGLPRLVLEIDELGISYAFKNWEAVFDICPRIRRLRLTLNIFKSVYGENLDLENTLAECNLSCLKEIEFKCQSSRQLTTENLNRFWIKRGHQLVSIIVTHANTHQVLFEPKDFRNIISMCPNLRNINMSYMLLNGIIGEEAVPEDFPSLDNLKELSIAIFGPTGSAVTEAFKVIYAAPNINKLIVDLYENEETILNLLRKKEFLFLNKLTICSKDRVSFYKYIDSDKIMKLSTPKLYIKK